MNALYRDNFRCAYFVYNHVFFFLLVCQIDLQRLDYTTGLQWKFQFFSGENRPDVRRERVLETDPR